MSRGRAKFTVSATHKVTNNATKRRIKYRTERRSPISVPTAGERPTVAAGRSLSALSFCVPASPGPDDCYFKYTFTYVSIDPSWSDALPSLYGLLALGNPVNVRV